MLNVISILIRMCHNFVTKIFSIDCGKVWAWKAVFHGHVMYQFQELIAKQTLLLHKINLSVMIRLTACLNLPEKEKEIKLATKYI